MVSKRITILCFILILGIALTASTQEIERNPEAISFDVSQAGYIQEWLVIGPFTSGV